MAWPKGRTNQVCRPAVRGSGRGKIGFAVREARNPGSAVVQPLPVGRLGLQYQRCQDGDPRLHDRDDLSGGSKDPPLLFVLRIVGARARHNVQQPTVPFVARVLENLLRVVPR